MRFLSSKSHTVIGVVVGVILILRAMLVGFGNDSTASMVALGVGIFIIVSELVTTSRYSLVKLVPMKIHLVLDYLTGIFLALSPWLFGFAHGPFTTWMPHLIVGILVVAYALVTNPDVDSGKSIVS
jgi:hypothetical protein